MDQIELLEVLALGEQPHIEFKQEGPLSDQQYHGTVIRAIMGMANRRDGGRVLLGVDDQNPESSPGVSEANQASWCRYDDVADKVSRYADPPISFQLERIDLDDGRCFISILIEEFQNTPIICKREIKRTGGEGERMLLRRGAVYIRPQNGKRETREIQGEGEMRLLLDLAAEKRLKTFMEMANRGGVLSSMASTSPTDQELFLRELGELGEPA